MIFDGTTGKVHSYPQVLWIVVIIFTINTVSSSDHDAIRIDGAATEVEVNTETGILETDLVGDLACRSIRASHNLVEASLEARLGRRCRCKELNKIFKHELHIHFDQLHNDICFVME